MKFTCQKSLLSEAVNNVLPAVSSKSSLLSLEGIKLICTGNQLSITGYNLELGITKNIEVFSALDGGIVLTANLLSNIINKMPEGNISFETDEKLLTIIKCEDVEFTILGMSCDEYPEMPIFTSDKEFFIDPAVLRKMISQTLFSVAQNDQNPIHTGSLFDIGDNCLNIVSVDGFRLAMKTEKIECEEKFKFVVPGKTLSEIVRLLARVDVQDEQVKVNISNKHINFLIDGYSFISRLLEGEFLDYRNAIPIDTITTVVIETRDFLDTMNRASIIISEKAKSPIRCLFEEQNVKIFCETAMGKINDEVECTIDGPNVKIGFNNKYMAEALKAAECDKIKIQMNGPISPIKIVPPDSENFLFLVLPVRLK